MARDGLRLWRRFWRDTGGAGRKSWLWRVLGVLFFLALPAPVLMLLVFRFVPVPGTPEMLVSFIQGKGLNYAWSDDIAPVLGRAVIGSEDQNFCRHNGFDWQGIDLAMKEHRKNPRKPLRGASTISQQTARTLFLVPTRSWVRKGLEAYLTVLVEALWPKKRILQAYLNLVDWGHGNFGAQAAAENYFGTDAGSLSRDQAARLAAILPDPSKWKAVHPGRYVTRRSRTLAARSGQVTRDRLDFCVH
jgi:monofunctional biosynthetic peptidoglycan transglycosylase